MSETAEEKEDILTTPFEELSEEEVERLTAFAGVAQRLMEAAELFDEVVKVLVLSLFRNETTNILLNVASLRVIIEGIEILVEKHGTDLSDATPDNIRGIISDYLSEEGRDLDGGEEEIVSAFEETHRRRNKS
jgi:hypothetical protein